MCIICPEKVAFANFFIKKQFDRDDGAYSEVIIKCVQQTQHTQQYITPFLLHA